MNGLTRENILEKFLTYNGTRDIKKTDYRISIEFVEILKYYHRNNENIKDIYKEYSTGNIANDFISKIYLPLIKEGNLTEEEINNWIRKIGYTDFGSHSLSFIDRYTKGLLAGAWYFWNWTETFGTKEEITKNMGNAQYLGWNLLFADLRGTFLNFIKESILPELKITNDFNNKVIDKKVYDEEIKKLYNNVEIFEHALIATQGTKIKERDGMNK